MRRRELSKSLRGTLLAKPRNSYNSFRITSLAHPSYLTSMESHRYEKMGGGDMLSPHRPVFPTFFASHSYENCRGVGVILLYPGLPRRANLELADHPQFTRSELLLFSIAYERPNLQVLCFGNVATVGWVCGGTRGRHSPEWRCPTPTAQIGRAHV